MKLTDEPIGANFFYLLFIIHISCLYSTPAARNDKSEQFWSGRVALHGKEAGNLQQSRKKNTCANRNGEAQLPQEQKDDIQGQKPCGHDSGNLLKSSAFFFVKFSCLIIDETAKENLERGSDHKTGEYNDSHFGGNDLN